MNGLDLPWQIDLLLIDALASLLIGVVLIERRVTHLRALETRVSWVAWNIVCLVLIIWGGSVTWQHAIYAVLTVWAVGKATARLMNESGAIYSEEATASIAAGKHKGGTHFIGVLVTLATLYLLIAGSR